MEKVDVNQPITGNVNLVNVNADAPNVNDPTFVHLLFTFVLHLFRFVKARLNSCLFTFVQVCKTQARLNSCLFTYFQVCKIYQSWIVCRRITYRRSLKYGYFITDLF